MGKDLSKMTLEELWALFPIFLVPHDDRWKDSFNEIRQPPFLLSWPPVASSRCAVCSPASCLASPLGLAPLLRVVLLLLFPLSLVRSLVVVFAHGRSAGVWLRWLRLRGACRSDPAVFLLVVASCLCFLNFF